MGEEHGVLVIIETFEAVLVREVEVLFLQIGEVLGKIGLFFLQLKNDFVELAIPALQIFND